MTELIVGDTAPLAQFQGDGVQTTFFYPFPILAADDLQVLIDGAPALEGENTSFTVTGVGESGGGNVTFDTPPAAGRVVTLHRVTPVLRTTDFLPAGEFRAVVINEELDRLTLEMQEAAAGLRRSLGAPWGDGAIEMTLPDAQSRAGRHLAFDDDGIPLARFVPDAETVARTEEIALDAEAAAARAEAWADNPEDTEVDPGRFSALHHARKAEAHAAAAETFDPASYVPKTGGAFGGQVKIDAAAALEILRSADGANKVQLSFDATTNKFFVVPHDGTDFLWGQQLEYNFAVGRWIVRSALEAQSDASLKFATPTLGQPWSMGTGFGVNDKVALFLNGTGGNEFSFEADGVDYTTAQLLIGGKRALTTDDLGQVYDSGWQSFSNDAWHNFAHGLGAEPGQVGVFLKCTSASGGFAVGDVVAIAPSNIEIENFGNGNGSGWGWNTLVTDTEVKLWVNRFRLMTKTSGGDGLGIDFTPGPGSFQLKVTARF